MFILLQLVNVGTLILNFIQKYFFYVYYEIEDPKKALKSECTLDPGKDVGSYIVDSSLTEILVCFELSLPI